MNREILKLIPFLHSPHLFSEASLNDEQRFLLVLLRRSLQKADKRSLFSAADTKIQDPESLFFKIVMEDFKRREARLFAAHLLFRKDFYQFIRPLIQIIVQAQNAKDEPCCSMLPDEIILRKITAIQTQETNRLSIWGHLAALKKSVQFRPRWAAAAAAAVAIVVIFFAYGMFKTNELYKEYFILPAEPFSSLCAETYAFRSTFRGTSEPQSKWRENYRMALTAYLAKDYQKAVELFEQVEPFSEFQGDLSEPWQREFFFHYALARLGKSGGKPVHRRECAEASRLFEKALTLQTNQNDADEIRFFLGLSFLLQGEASAADSCFRQISPSSSFYHQSQKISLH